MSNPPALPAPGGNATAALAVADAGRDEVVIHSGPLTTVGFMGCVGDEHARFDPNDTSVQPGVLDLRVELGANKTTH